MPRRRLRWRRTFFSSAAGAFSSAFGSSAAGGTPSGGVSAGGASAAGAGAGAGGGAGAGAAGNWHVNLMGPAPAVLSCPTISALDLTGTSLTATTLPPMGSPAVCQQTAARAQEEGRMATRRKAAASYSSGDSHLCSAARNAVAGDHPLDRDAHAEAALPLGDAHADGRHG